MPRPKIMWASVALGFLTLGELVSLYQLMFDIWMTAYPFADTGRMAKAVLYPAHHNYRYRTPVEHSCRVAVRRRRKTGNNISSP